MTPIRLFGLVFVAAAVACGGEDGLGAPPPVAGLRFINAVADTGAMDFRVIDVVGDAPQLLEYTFRGASPYQAVEAGSRRLRVFMTPSRTDSSVGSPMIWDTTFTFTAGTNYSVIMTGFARSGGAAPLQMLIAADAAADPGAGMIAVRLVHAGTGLGTLDAFSRRSGAAPGDPLASNLDFGAVGTYLALPADTPTMRIAVAAAGTTTPLIADVLGPAGLAGTASANPIAGTNVGQSVLSVILVPPSVAGSQAPASFTTPSMLFIADRRPPLTVPGSP